MCSSSYVRSRGPPGEAPALPQFLPQYFKFLAHNPLSVRTKVPAPAGRAARGPLGRGWRMSGGPARGGDVQAVGPYQCRGHAMRELLRAGSRRRRPADAVPC